MKWFRILTALAIIACFVPMGLTLGAAWVASSNGCTLNEGNVNPCVIGGRDYGATLYNMAMMAWLMLFTLPYAVMFVILWVIVEIVRFIRARRAAA